MPWVVKAPVFFNREVLVCEVHVNLQTIDFLQICGPRSNTCACKMDEVSLIYYQNDHVVT